MVISRKEPSVLAGTIIAAFHSDRDGVGTAWLECQASATVRPAAAGPSSQRACEYLVVLPQLRYAHTTLACTYLKLLYPRRRQITVNTLYNAHKVGALPSLKADVLGKYFAHGCRRLLNHGHFVAQ